MTSTRTRPPGSTLRTIGASAVAKIVVLGLSGVLAVLTTRLIIGDFGIDAYAQYGLLTSMALLLPFADLGMSAAVINAVAGSDSPRTDPRVRRTLVSALRILLAATGVITLVAIGLTAFDSWPWLLGEGLLDGGGTAAFVCLVVFGATLPLGVGQRILTGLGRNHTQIIAGSLAAPFVLIAVFLISRSGGGGNYLAVVSYLASALVAAVCLCLASRAIRPQVRAAVVDVPRLRSERGLEVMNVAWPMLAQMLALPVALQTDRLLLSHLSGVSDLAQYNLAAQLFGLILQTIGAAGIALWPIFARARSSSVVHSPLPLAAAFLIGGLGLAAVLALVLPVVTPIVSDGRISLDPALVIGFVVFVGAQAAKYPLGMYMTDVPGLRFQVLPIVLMVPLNLAISWLLIGPLGAAGPIIGSAVAVTACQVGPNLWYVVRDMNRRRTVAAAGSPD